MTIDEEIYLELDGRRRATFGARIGRPDQFRYLVTTESDGTIVMKPAIVMSEEERAFLSNSSMVLAVQEALTRPPSTRVRRNLAPPNPVPAPSEEVSGSQEKNRRQYPLQGLPNGLTYEHSFALSEGDVEMPKATGNSRVTSPRAASAAGKTLANPKAPAAAKSAAASALAQTAPVDQTKPRAASAAGKTLANPKATSAAKSAAASALAQTPSTKKPSAKKK
jgi:DNA-binding protein HU-beta